MGKKGKIPWNKGLKKSRGEIFYGKPLTEETKRKISLANTGKKRTFESKRKMSLAKKGKMVGPAHPRWKGGFSEESLVRGSLDYKEWRGAVYRRDYYRCLICGIHCVSGNIVAHHINPFKTYPHIRFDVDNGITLCRKHHLLVHRSLKELIKEAKEVFPNIDFESPARIFAR